MHEPGDTLTVGELATKRPRAIKILQQHNIDFCCGGKRHLSRVCAEAGVDVDTLLAKIDAEEARDATPVTDWSTAPLAELITFITERYHQPLPADLEHLERLAEKVERVHGASNPNLAPLAASLAEMRGELLPHIDKEDRILFPWILAGSGPSAGAPVRVMIMEHDDAGRILRELREHATGYVPPDGACKSWRALYEGLARFDAELKEHIHLENNVLFPRALMGESVHTATARI